MKFVLYFHIQLYNCLYPLYSPFSTIETLTTSLWYLFNVCLNAVPEGETSERFHRIQLCLSTTDCWHNPLHQKGSLIRPALLVKSVFTHFLLSTHLTCGHGYGCLLPSLEVSPVTGLLRDRYDKVFITQVLTLFSTEIITSGCNYSLKLPT